MPFQKGNQLGKAKAGQVSSNSKEAREIKEHILKRIKEEIDPMCDALIAEAKKGNTQAFKELLDRGVGKATESLDITSDGKSIIIEVAKEIAKKNGLDDSTKPNSE